MLLVLEVEEREPATKALSSTVPMEGTSFHSLGLQPAIGVGWNVSNVLFVEPSGPRPLGISPPVVTLHALHKLHTRQWTDGVPLWSSERVPLVIQVDHIRGRAVLPFTEARSVDPPRSGPSFGSVKLGPTSNHVSKAKAFVGVDEVAPAVFDFLDVDVGSKAEDVRVVRAQHSNFKSHEGHRVVRCPR